MSDQFQIEAGIPIPATRRGPKTQAPAFPLAQLAVGQSFLVPCNVEDEKAVSAWRRKLLVARKRHPELKFITATCPGEGLRVWRAE